MVVGSKRVAPLAVVFVVLVVGAGIGIGLLHYRGERAAARKRAKELLALGRLEMDESPSSALAFARASLELFDDRAGRRFALEALSRGPTARILWQGATRSPAFSPDGSWLAINVVDPSAESSLLFAFHRSGGRPRKLERQQGPILFNGFDAGSSYLVSQLEGAPVKLFSLPDGGELGAIRESAVSRVLPSEGGLFLFSSSQEGESILERWSFGPRGFERLSRQPLPVSGPSALRHADVDRQGRWLAHRRGDEIVLSPLDGSRETILGPATGETFLRFDQSGERLAANDGTGLRVWVFESGVAELARRFAVEREASAPPGFHPSAPIVATGGQRGMVRLWHLDGPPEAGPVLIRRRDRQPVEDLCFDPSGRWLVTSGEGGGTLWNIGHADPLVVEVGEAPVRRVWFDPEGESVFSVSQDGVMRQWWLSGDESMRVVGAGEGTSGGVDPSGRFVWTPVSGLGAAVFPLDAELDPASLSSPDAAREQGATLFGGFEDQVWGSAMSHDGRLLAASGGQFVEAEAVIRVWDLESGESRVLDAGDGEFTVDLAFTGDGHLIASGVGGVRIWDVEAGTFETLVEEASSSIALSPDETKLLVVGFEAAFGKGQEVRIVDLADRTIREFSAHGDRIVSVSFDPTGTQVASGDDEGVVRVGPLSGREPFMLLGHTGSVRSVAWDPAGNWIASGGSDGTLRLWPIPAGGPFFSVDHEALVERLRQLTNYRVVEDPTAPDGFRLEVGQFRGWNDAPTW